MDARLAGDPHDMRSFAGDSVSTPGEVMDSRLAENDPSNWVKWMASAAVLGDFTERRLRRGVHERCGLPGGTD